MVILHGADTSQLLYKRQSDFHDITRHWSSRPKGLTATYLVRCWVSDVRTLIGKRDVEMFKQLSVDLEVGTLVFISVGMLVGIYNHRRYLQFLSNIDIDV